MNVAALLGLPDLDGDLARTDALLREAVALDDDPFLGEAAGHLVAAGGKRFRPALTIAAAAAASGGTTGETSERVLMGGVACELMQVGSLYHDDVIDDAEVRRGVPSANAKWGNTVAILVGDFLLGKASEIATDLGVEVAAVLARTLVRMCEGQVAELQTTFSTERTVAAYERSIGGKTAALMAASCKVGALCAGAPLAVVDALEAYGEAFGMAFQIYDDLADLLRTEEELGKPAGHDMEEGVYTLPVLVALADPGLGPELRSLLGGPIDATARDRALALVRSSNGVAQAVARGREMADRAAATLASLPHGPVRDSLAGLGHQLLDHLGT